MATLLYAVEGHHESCGASCRDSFELPTAASAAAANPDWPRNLPAESLAVAVLTVDDGNGINQAFRVGDCCYAFQYHLEVNTEILAQVIARPCVQPMLIFLERSSLRSSMLCGGTPCIHTPDCFGCAQWWDEFGGGLPGHTSAGSVLGDGEAAGPRVAALRLAALRQELADHIAAGQVSGAERFTAALADGWLALAAARRISPP